MEYIYFRRTIHSEYHVTVDRDARIMVTIVYIDLPQFGRKNIQRQWGHNPTRIRDATVHPTLFCVDIITLG